MSLNIELTKAFGWSVLVWGPGHYILGWILASKVVKARETLKVPLPNLYATPGHHDKADQFNSIQRGHQNMIESLSCLQLMALFGSLYSDNCAYANAIGGITSIVGNVLYQKGYAEHYQDKVGRYKKGGAIKFLGHLIALATSVMMCLSLSGFI